MGLMNKIKAAFGGKKSGASKPKAGKTAAQFKATGKVGDALKYAGNKIDAQVAAGKFDEKKAAMFVASLKDIEASSASDDDKLIQIGQVIGAITFL